MSTVKVFTKPKIIKKPLNTKLGGMQLVTYEYNNKTSYLIFGAVYDKSIYEFDPTNIYYFIFHH